MQRIEALLREVLVSLAPVLDDVRRELAMTRAHCQPHVVVQHARLQGRNSTMKGEKTVMINLIL